MSHEEELIPVTVWLAERSYRIKVTPSEEESVRRAIKVADEKITELRGSYAGKDNQDFIAMCLLMYATDSATENGGTPSVYVEEEVKKMIGRIDNALID